MSGFDVGMSGGTDVVYDLPLGFDAEGEVNASIQLVGKNSELYRNSERTLTRMSLKKSAVRGRPLDLKKDSDSDEFVEQREAHNIALAVAATVGWTGLTSGGQEYAYSPDVAKTLYTSNSYLLAKVLAAIEDQNNFLKV